VPFPFKTVTRGGQQNSNVPNISVVNLPVFNLQISGICGKRDRSVFYENNNKGSKVKFKILL